MKADLVHGVPHHGMWVKTAAAVVPVIGVLAGSAMAQPAPQPSGIPSAQSSGSGAPPVPPATQPSDSAKPPASPATQPSGSAKPPAALPAASGATPPYPQGYPPYPQGYPPYPQGYPPYPQGYPPYPQGYPPYPQGYPPYPQGYPQYPQGYPQQGYPQYPQQVYPPQYPQGYPQQPPPPVAELQADPPPEPKVDKAALYNQRRLGFELGFSGFFVPGVWYIRDGMSLELDATYRAQTSATRRFEVGAGFRGIGTTDTMHYTVGVPMRFVMATSRYFEVRFGLTPGFSHIAFASPHYSTANAFSGRFEFGMQIPIGSHVVVGFTPTALMLLASPKFPMIIAYEPRMWVGAGFL